MTDEAYGATVAKRRLSRRLLQLRVQSGYTANHVCDMLNWGRGKVGRFEANQWKRPEMSDIRDLLRIYGVGEDEREQLEDLAIQSRARPWWRDYSDIFENEFPGFENDASRIRVFMPLVLPGLLQTQDYDEDALQHVPVLRMSPDTCLEQARDLLHHRRRLLLAVTFGRHRYLFMDMHAPVITLEPQDHGHQRRAGLHGERGRAARHAGLLAEELHLHAGAGDIAVTDQADKLAGPKPLRQDAERAARPPLAGSTSTPRPSRNATNLL